MTTSRLRLAARLKRRFGTHRFTTAKALSRVLAVDGLVFIAVALFVVLAALYDAVLG